MNLPSPRVVLHCGDGSCRLLDPAEIFWLEADAEETWVHVADGSRIKDDRSLAELCERLSSLGFIRIHRTHAVNLYRVTKVEVCDNGKDLEIELAAPLKTRLPVNDMGRRILWSALGETG